MGNTNDLLETSIRPYKNKAEFDLNYPISYKPTIGIVDNSTNQSISLALPFIQQSANSNGVSGRYGSGGGAGGHNTFMSSRGARRMVKPMVSSSSSSGSGYKKNIYSDLEFREYFEWGNLQQLIYSLFQSFAKNYFKLLISQPFEVSRVLLQIGSFKKQPGRIAGLTDKESAAALGVNEDDEDSDDDDDDSRYFARAGSPRPRRTSIEKTPKSVRSFQVSSASKGKTTTQLQPVTLNSLDLLSSLCAKEGATGALKAINTSFLVNTLQYTIESWISGFFAGLLGVPDPLFVDLIHSPNANLSLLLSVVSNVLTGLILSQVSLIKTKFMVTNVGRGIRSFREIVATVPNSFLFVPSTDLIMPNVMSNLVKSLAEYYPDYLLTAVFQINKYNSPTIYNTLLLLFKVCGLFIKLPFETLYNRAQVHFLLNNREVPEAMRISNDDLSVKFGGYYGYFATLYHIIGGTKPVNYGSDNSFGANIVLEDSDKNEINKGWQAAFRGWAPGLVKLTSKFTLKLISSSSSNGMTEEQF
ncbi:unnamed protein product [Ambrosiozyma monospora]|uniref:Unnamed protein product n=1 Tax=Ambrosiozyma monospora TaxID=43982 RepID=A0A9W6YUK6_AMBMO|nr:unnamed protein product [Ambrosiozyma monospora]